MSLPSSTNAQPPRDAEAITQYLTQQTATEAPVKKSWFATKERLVVIEEKNQSGKKETHIEFRRLNILERCFAKLGFGKAAFKNVILACVDNPKLIGNNDKTAFKRIITAYNNTHSSTRSKIDMTNEKVKALFTEVSGSTTTSTTASNNDVEKLPEMTNDDFALMRRAYTELKPNNLDEASQVILAELKNKPPYNMNAADRKVWVETAKALLASKPVASTQPAVSTRTDSSAIDAAAANKECFKNVIPKLIAGSTLPGAKGDTKMTGEEHIYAMLADKLITQDKRKDVVILPFGSGNQPPRLPPLNDSVRFIISPCSVSNNTHNTILVIDRQHKPESKYFYFDSLGWTAPEELSEIVQHHKDAGYLTDKSLQNTTKGSKQTDGWSCGFHAVENAVAVVSGKIGEISDKPLNGNQLRDKYSGNYDAFVKANAIENPDYNRAQRRQKMYLRDALQPLVNEQNNTPEELFALFDGLRTNLRSDEKEEAFLNFRNAFLSASPNNTIALQTLASATNGGGEIFAILSQIPFEPQPLPADTDVLTKAALDKKISDWKKSNLGKEPTEVQKKQWYFDIVVEQGTTKITDCIRKMLTTSA